MKNRVYKVIVIVLFALITTAIFAIGFSLLQQDKIKKQQGISDSKQENKLAYDNTVFNSLICKDSLVRDVNEGNTWITIGTELVRPIFKCEYNSQTKVTSEKWGIEIATDRGIFIEVGDLPKLGYPSITYAGGSFLRVEFCYEGCGQSALVELNKYYTEVVKVTNIADIRGLEKYALNDAATVVVQDKLIFIAPRHILELDRNNFQTTVLVEVPENQMIGQESALPAFMPEYAILKDRLYYSVYADKNRELDGVPKTRSYVKYIEIQ
jgi:hypothetical protein